MVQKTIVHKGHLKNAKLIIWMT